MSLRTVPARWFEVLTLPEAIPRAVESLARTGSVELETPGMGLPAMALPDLKDRMDRFRELAEHYEDYWPEPASPAEEPAGSLDTALDGALGRLQGWAAEADPRIRAIESLHRDHQDLSLLQGFLGALGTEAPLDLGRLGSAGPTMASVLFVLPPSAAPPAGVEEVLVRQVRTGRHLFLLVLGPTEAVRRIREDLSGRRARTVEIPAWLRGSPGSAMAGVTDRLAELDEQITRNRRAIAELNQRHEVAEALGEIRRLEWLVGHMPRVPVSEHFAWITGWTDDRSGETLGPALGDLPALIHFPPPPADKDAPLLLHNPRWARPFELFARLIGTPGRGEADPSITLAVITPLLFGYMFGDVGHGLVLAGVGWILRHRVPTLRLLIPGGLAAVAFGFLFGSVFALEHLFPPLWTHPLADPLPVLLAPLGFGAGLLLLSMSLEGLQEAWLGRLPRWLRVDAGLMVLYVGILASAWLRSGAWLALAGLAWFLTGAAWEKRAQGWLAVPAGLGELAEQGLRLLVNTLSFARVGAFALAHSGLSQAVTSLGTAAGFGVTGALVLVIGNAVIIALEGLVVSIQTTRLVLFEFFVRFLHGGGRPFRPIGPPEARALLQGQGEAHASTAP